MKKKLPPNYGLGLLGNRTDASQFIKSCILPSFVEYEEIIQIKSVLSFNKTLLFIHILN